MNQILKPGSLVDQIGKDQKILALSWKQPYAFLMPPPFNKVETRKWPTKYRTWVLICASLTSYKSNQILSISGPSQFNRITEAARGHEAKIYESRGNAVSIGYLADCRPMTKEDENLCFVEYYSDLYCHIYENVYHIEPFRWHGKQGWSTVTEEISNKIIIL